MADTQCSERCIRKDVEVQVLFPAPDAFRAKRELATGVLGNLSAPKCYERSELVFGVPVGCTKNQFERSEN